jgi:hypothetical protein
MTALSVVLCRPTGCAVSDNVSFCCQRRGSDPCLSTQVVDIPWPSYFHLVLSYLVSGGLFIMGWHDALYWLHWRVVRLVHMRCVGFIA